MPDQRIAVIRVGTAHQKLINPSSCVAAHGFTAHVVPHKCSLVYLECTATDRNFHIQQDTVILAITARMAQYQEQKSTVRPVIIVDKEVQCRKLAHPELSSQVYELITLANASIVQPECIATTADYLHPTVNVEMGTIAHQAKVCNTRRNTFAPKVIIAR